MPHNTSPSQATPVVGPVQQLHETKFLSLVKREVQWRGHQSEWVYATRDAQAASPFQAAQAAVVLQSPEGPRIVLNREFRVPLNDFEWSFPAGICDGQESAEATAKRELAEETNLQLVEVFTESPPMFSSAGLSDEATVTVFGTAEGELSTANTETSECLEVHALLPSEVAAILHSVKWSARAWPVVAQFAATGHLPGQPQTVYPVTALRIEEGAFATKDMRSFGWLLSEEAALQAVAHNCGSMSESRYNYLVIEANQPGIHGPCRVLHWFQWDAAASGWVACETPDNFEGVFGFCMG